MCSSKASQATILRRAALRKRKGFQQIIAAHEAAGDRACEHHLFDIATQHYQEGLNVGAISPDDHKRLAQKLGSIWILTSDPAATNRRDTLDASRRDTNEAEKAVKTLLEIISHMWIDSKTEGALPLCEEAVRIAQTRGTDRLRQHATLHLSNLLIQLARYDDAAQYLDTIDNIESIDDRTMYYWNRGHIAAARGLAAEAYGDFEKAVRYAKEGGSLYRITSVLGDYGLNAIGLGDIERGKELYEQALLIARQNHLGWLVPLLCMGYARILMVMGQYSAARVYVVEALSSDAHAPILDERFAAIGIPLALHLMDDAILAQCIRPSAIELAFQSGEPGRVGPVATAFAQLYTKQGQGQKARTLLRRALQMVTNAHENIDFPLAVAEYGAAADIPRARALLEARVRLPSALVAEAMLLFFDALVAQRSQKMTASPTYAIKAAARFDDLHWYACAGRARSLLSPAILLPSSDEIVKGPFATMKLVLTEREQQVAELAIQGLANHAIAEKLSISKFTVESHMRSIMGQLGIRSRYQLIDRLHP